VLWHNWTKTRLLPSKNSSSLALAQTDALAKLLIERGLIRREEFMQKISEERATYQRMLHAVE
jgi:hypothetical protein